MRPASPPSPAALNTVVATSGATTRATARLRCRVNQFVVVAMS
jgi:hypothetical protein